MHSCFQLGVIFVMKLDKEPDPHANWSITQLMVSLMELIGDSEKEKDEGCKEMESLEGREHKTACCGG